MPDRGLSLQSDDAPEPQRGGGTALIVLLAVLVLALAGLGFLHYRSLQRTAAVEAELARVAARAEESATRARQAWEKAEAAETASRAAAEGRQVAEVKALSAQEEADGARLQAETSRLQAETARQEATVAAATAEKVKADAEAVRKRAEADVNRLETALGQIGDTRRTALGLVMNLGSDRLKFEFNKAGLSPADRELLSRVAGILMTARDYTIAVGGHTDDVGNDAYNQKLSERRAQAVRDYLVQAGMPPDMLTVAGYGKTQPLVQGTSDAARAKNRRVELGIVQAGIRYKR